MEFILIIFFLRLQLFPDTPSFPHIQHVFLSQKPNRQTNEHTPQLQLLTPDHWVWVPTLVSLNGLGFRKPKPTKPISPPVALVMVFTTAVVILSRHGFLSVLPDLWLWEFFSLLFQNGSWAFWDWGGGVYRCPICYCTL